MILFHIYYTHFHPENIYLCADYTILYISDQLKLAFNWHLYVCGSGMLPKQVADDLRQGKPSQAQSYVSATVFFR